MAVEDRKNPSISGERLAPGDAAFERLKRREAMKSREDRPEPESSGPGESVVRSAEMADATAPITAREPDKDALAAGETVAEPTPSSEEHPELPSTAPADAVAPARSVDPVLAVAAAFGFEILPPEPEAPVATVAATALPEAEPPRPLALDKVAPIPAPAAPHASSPEQDAHVPARAPVMSAAAIAAPQEAREPAEGPQATPPAPKLASGEPRPKARTRAPAPKAPQPALPQAQIAAPRVSATEPPARRAAPGPADATAARLEAALLDQLRSLEETLVDDLPAEPPRLPRAEPLRTSPAAHAGPAADGAAKRSVFAPDPIRQRSYVDLRNPPPEPGPEAAADAPWRKYLAEPPRRSAPVRSVSRGPAQRPAAPRSQVAAAVQDHKAEVLERRRGVRAMTAAAVLGLGVGLGLVVLIRPFSGGDGSTVAATAPDTPAIVAATEPVAPGGEPAPSHVEGALATLLSEAPLTHAQPRGPAVISDAGTLPPTAGPAERTAVIAEDAAATPAPPIVIRPPPGEARPTRRTPDAVPVQSGAMAYVPAVPSFDPVRQSLLADEARGNPEPEADSAPPADSAGRGAVTTREVPADVRPGRATINTFVNMRAKPDNAAPIVAILADGLAVKVIGCDYWCEIEAGGKRGYVFKKFLSR